MVMITVRSAGTTGRDANLKSATFDSFLNLEGTLKASLKLRTSITRKDGQTVLERVCTVRLRIYSGNRFFRRGEAT